MDCYPSFQAPIPCDSTDHTIAEILDSLPPGAELIEATTEPAVVVPSSLPTTGRDLGIPITIGNCALIIGVLITAGRRWLRGT